MSIAKTAKLCATRLTPLSSPRCNAPLARRVAAFDDHLLDDTPAIAPVCRSRLIFGRCMARRRLLESRKLDHHVALEIFGAFDDFVAPAAREHLAAEFRDDAGDEIGVLLVFDRIVDPAAGEPVCGHFLFLSRS